MNAAVETVQRPARPAERPAPAKGQAAPPPKPAAEETGRESVDLWDNVPV